MYINLNIDPKDAEKLQAALSDEAFADSLFAMQSPEEVQTALKTRDVDLTIDEINDIAKALNAANESGELTEDRLEDVAGGVMTLPYNPARYDPKTGRFTITIYW